MWAHAPGRFIISSIGLLFGLSVLGQTGKYSLTWLENNKITTRSNDKIIQIEYLKFAGATYIGEDFLPLYTKSVKLPENSSKINYFIKNLEYETVADSLLNKVSIPTELPPSKPKLEIYKSGKESNLVIEIFSLRKNENTGKLERLLSFEIAEDTMPAGIKILNEKSGKESLKESVLSSGYWYKIKVYKSGIYKITYSDLLGMGFSNLSNIRIYGNGGKQISYLNSDPRPGDVQECPIYLSIGTDGIFNDGDYLLFYAEGPIVWKYDQDNNIFRQVIHYYSDASYYFLTTDLGAGKKIQTIDNRNLANTINVNSYNAFAYYEKNLLNLIRSGREWYSNKFDKSPFDTTFQFPGLLIQEQVIINAKMAGRSKGNRIVIMKVNNLEVDTESIPPVNFIGSYYVYANDVFFNYKFNSPSNQIKVGFEYGAFDLSDEAYIDYITINTRCVLSVNQEPFFFRDIKSVGDGNIAEYTISNINEIIQIWDVTNVNDVFAILGEKSGSTYKFKATSDELREYVLVNSGTNYPKPVIAPSVTGVGEVPNQNLRGQITYNYIIVAPDVFLAQADSIAVYYRNNSDLSVLTVTQDQIFNEFSSGTPDVSAIRDFFKYQYDNGSGNNILRYALLFGDGSYNNHMYKKGNTNYILTYQSENSLLPTNSYVTDDFFGLLDNNEGGSLGLLDIGIGRLPVKMQDGDVLEAEHVVNKILSYYRSDLKDWRSTLCFLADDGLDVGSEDGTVFMFQADSLARMADRSRPGFDIKKIYLDANPQVTSASGPSYPQSHDELIRTINKGVLLINYTGHGGENGITGEKVFQTQDVVALKNKNKLPLFITATCEFSRFDDVEMKGQVITTKTGAGETFLLSPDGGGIALFSTTRVVNSEANFNLEQKVFKYIFAKNEYGKRERLGDIVKKAKNDLGNDPNKLNFALLGDPAMILAYPEFQVITDSVNNIPVQISSDTLKAYSKVTVSGHVAYDDGSLIQNFIGSVFPRVYDKPMQITTLGNDDQPPYQYTDQRNILYKGEATVSNGRFTFSFVIPKDIAYGIGKGKISYYAENGQIDAQGEYKEVFVGGTSEKIITDFNGPIIELFMNDTLFKDGGITNNNPYFYARLRDENGINTTGVGIGHDITAFLNSEENNLFILNDYYQALIDDYRSGIVYYPLNDIAEGDNRITMKAWDIFNNSSEATIGFVVKSSDGLVLDKLINYPNPAYNYTIFQYSHNYPGEEHEIMLEVFDLSGRKVKAIERKIYEPGFVSTPLEWNLRCASGNILQPGLYLYRMKVTTTAGTSYINQKLIINR
jgi:hypothetical protein